MLFRSDNVAGVSPPILAAIAGVAEGDSEPYGDDPLTHALPARFEAVLGRPCLVVPVGSGIAANALALSLAAGPLDSALASAEAHVAQSEGGAFELFTQGAKLALLAGREGKVVAGELAGMLEDVDFARSATMPPRVLSLTQPTERGLLYRLDELAAIAAVARRFRLAIHLDGARLGNAVAALGCSAAELVAAADADLISFGATKNGAMSADAVVVLDRALAERLAQRTRRAGQMVSKMRFMAAQLHAYLADDLWLANARAANRSARLLAEGLAGLPGIALAWPVETNLVFLTIAPEAQRRLATAGIRFRPRNAMRPQDNLFRLVPSFATTEAEIARVVAGSRAALGGGAG